MPLDPHEIASGLEVVTLPKYGSTFAIKLAMELIRMVGEDEVEIIQNDELVELAQRCKA